MLLAAYALEAGTGRGLEHNLSDSVHDDCCDGPWDFVPDSRAGVPNIVGAAGIVCSHNPRIS